MAGRTREAADGLRGFLKSSPNEYRRVCDFVDWARANHHESQPLHEVLGEHHVARREFGAALEALERVDKTGLSSLLEARLANLHRFLQKTPGSLPKSAVPLLYFAAGGTLMLVVVAYKAQKKLWQADMQAKQAGG